jgi:hypothetical protein
VANYCSGKCNDAKSKFIFHAWVLNIV